MSNMDDILASQRAKRAKIENEHESSLSNPIHGYQQGMRGDCTSTEALLNFHTAADELELNLKRQKIPRDPMSHRIIEKRRRDRMNNCLADLSRLIPSSYHKQGQGRIEKTEIIEMAIKHINLLQQQVEELDKKAKKGPAPSQTVTFDQQCCASKFYLGFKEAQDEVMRFWVEVQNASTMDPFCKKIMKHLERASKKFITNHCWTMKSEKKGTQWSYYDQPNKIVDQECDQLQSNKRKLERAEIMDTAGEVQSARRLGQMLDKHEDHLIDGASGQTSYMQHEQSGFYESNKLGSDRISSTDRNCGPDRMREHRPDESCQDLEAKQRDQHLRSLLSDQQHSSTQKGNNTSETESNGCVPMFSYSNMSSLNTSGDQGSSGYSSDLSNPEKGSCYNSASRSNNDNVYKFKHNITKRFSQEGHHMGQGHTPQPSDSSSSTSSHDLEDDQRHFKWKGATQKGHPSVLDGGHETMFREENEGTNCNKNIPNMTDMDSISSEDCKRPRDSGKSKSGKGDCESSSYVLPGFILHPSGTHYMPISVQNTNITGLLDDSIEDGRMPVFHPISIPVHFRRPVI